MRVHGARKRRGWAVWPAVIFSRMETRAREKLDQESAGSADALIEALVDHLARMRAERNYGTARKKAEGSARRRVKRDAG